MDDDTITSILFVCLGNICRSPLAEGVLREMVAERGLDHRYRIDSAGTGAWHAGSSPDARSVEVARRNGIALEGTARQVEPADFDEYDWIVAMDRSNLQDLRGMRYDGRDAGRGTGAADPDAEPGEDERPRIVLLRRFDPDPGDREVPDPYYGGPGGFDDVYTMVRRSLESFLDHLEEEREG